MTNYHLTTEPPEYWDIEVTIECDSTISLSAYLDGNDLIDTEIKVTLHGVRIINRYFPERGGVVCEGIVAHTGMNDLDKAINDFLCITKAHKSVWCEQMLKYEGR